MNKTTFFPGQGVGDLRFGISEDELPQLYDFVFDPEVSGDPLSSDKSFYSEKYGTRADFEDEKLSNVSCYKTIFFKGTQLIGLNFKSIEHLICKFEYSYDKEETFLSSGPQKIVYVDKIGLSLWIDNSGTIISVDCIAPWS